ncbi:MAG TPA: DUF4013 domain-containing protein [Thermoflexales bacterium]|nr:DUF4013 domain-containing protein [Thermoflexales bacterium]HRA00808.1 DUF4013 domain-containing protein [Thermoflexales bacterium]
MDNSFSITDLKAVLRFPFSGPRGKSNFFIGSLLMAGGMFVPILPVLAAYGYLAQIMRSAIKGEEPTMPEWGNFGKLLLDGLRGALISLIYVLPGILAILFAYIAYMGGLISTITAQRGSYYGGGLPDNFFSFYLWIGVFFIGFVVGMALLILGLIPTPVALANFVAKDKFAAGFELRKVTGIIRKDKLGYFVAWVVLMGLYYTSYMLFFLLYSTIIFCFAAFLVLMPLAFYVMLVGAVLFGRFYRENAPSEV